jgi:hypothetical protein
MLHRVYRSVTLVSPSMPSPPLQRLEMQSQEEPHQTYGFLHVCRADFCRLQKQVAAAEYSGLPSSLP